MSKRFSIAVLLLISWGAVASAVASDVSSDSQNPAIAWMNQMAALTGGFYVQVTPRFYLGGASSTGAPFTINGSFNSSGSNINTQDPGF